MRILPLVFIWLRRTFRPTPQEKLVKILSVMPISEEVRKSASENAMKFSDLEAEKIIQAIRYRLLTMPKVARDLREKRLKQQGRPMYADDPPPGDRAYKR